MNKKCEVSVTVVILLLLLLATFAGTTFYIWYTNYLKEQQASVDQVPPIEVATIIDIGSDQNTFYVTVRNNKFQDITVPKEGHVVGVYKGSGSTPCSLEGDEFTLTSKESGVATIPFDVKSGTTYYIIIEVVYEGTSYMIVQYYTAPP
ncbi:MAG: hypothetical protein KAV48_01280 [Methanomicrobia archaeon]|nr:hypothetical protein [Methanomicrobia archaeon]